MTELIKDEYLIHVLQLMKDLAFHEIFMEKLREELCDNDKFDPFTAFKTIDSFRHNMIINVELKGFLQHEGYDVTAIECEYVIKALNKSEDSLNYERFLQMIMPYNVVKRNLSLSRYNKVSCGIGTYGLLNQVKNTSRQEIAKFIVKEVQFVRRIGFKKQQFCKRWGGDVYTIVQELFKRKNQAFNQSLHNPLFEYRTKAGFDLMSQSQDIDKKQVDFGNFCQFARKYKCFFNREEFKGIWRRIKQVEEKIVLKAEEVFLKEDDFVSFLLVKDFNTKVKYASGYDIPLDKLQNTKPPSYKLPVQRQLIHNSYEYRQEQQNRYIQRKLGQIRKQIEVPSYKLKYPTSYPELQHNCVSSKLRQKQQDLKQIAQKMSQVMVNEKYYNIVSSEKQRHFMYPN